MGKGAWIGLMYLDEGEYAARGGLGNKVLYEFKIEDGIIYDKVDEEWVVKDTINR